MSLTESETILQSPPGQLSGQSRVLVVDDQVDLVRALKLLLGGEGFEVTTVNSPRAALDVASRQQFDLALIDLNYTRDTTSGQEGLELLAALRKLDTGLPVVVMTAWSTVEVAVRAMQEGASDFVEKPWKNRRLLSILQNQARLGTSMPVYSTAMFGILLITATPGKKCPSI